MGTHFRADGPAGPGWYENPSVTCASCLSTFEVPSEGLASCPCGRLSAELDAVGSTTAYMKSGDTLDASGPSALFQF